MEIEISYEPEFRDYFRVVKRAAMKRFRSFVVMLIAVPLALVVFTVTEPQRPDRPQSQASGAWTALLIPAGFAAFFYGSLYYSARKQWGRASDLREPRRIVVSESGFDVKGKTFSGQTEWINIAAGEKVGNIYVLRSRGGAYYCFPKKSFSSDSQVQDFLEIVRKKLGKSFRG